MAAQQNNTAVYITMLIAVAGGLYFLWKNDVIQTGISAADTIVNPQDFTDENAPVAAAS